MQSEARTIGKKSNDELPLIVEFIGDDSSVKRPEPPLEFSSRKWQAAKEIPIKSMRQLRQNLEEGSTLELVFDLRGTGMAYQTAADLAIYPKNNPSEVKALAERLGYHLSQRFVFEKNEKSNKKEAKHPFPTPISVQEAFEEFIDFKGYLMKKVVVDFAQYAEDPAEKEK